MISEAVYLHYLNSLLDGDKKQCYQIVNSLLADGVSLKEIFINLFQRSMYRVGHMWENERCLISEEHIASNITETMIDYAVSNYTAAHPNGKTVLITCIEKEFHELGARIVAGYLEAAGYKVLFVGANTPQKDFLRLIKEKEPAIVGISNNFYLNFTRLTNLIGLINEEFPNQKIIIGGQAISEGIDEAFRELNNVKYISCLDSLEKYLENEN